MAEREVVLDGIFRIELTEVCRDLFGGSPARGRSFGEAEVATDAMDVGVDGNDQV